MSIRLYTVQTYTYACIVDHLVGPEFVGSVIYNTVQLLCLVRTRVLWCFLYHELRNKRHLLVSHVLLVPILGLCEAIECTYC